MIDGQVDSVVESAQQFIEGFVFAPYQRGKHIVFVCGDGSIFDRVNVADADVPAIFEEPLNVRPGRSEFEVADYAASRLARSVGISTRHERSFSNQLIG